MSGPVLTVQSPPVFDTVDFCRRLGAFRVDSQMLHTSETAASLCSLFSLCAVVRAEADYATATIHYTAMSPLFDILPEGMLPPEYKITVGIENGLVHFTALRVDPGEPQFFRPVKVSTVEFNEEVQAPSRGERSLREAP